MSNIYITDNGITLSVKVDGNYEPITSYSAVGCQVRDYVADAIHKTSFEEEINMNKVLELHAEREEKRIKDKYEKLKEDMYNDNLIVKDFKALEDTSKLAYDTLLKKYNTDGNTFITKTGYMYEPGYELSETIMENIRESLAPDFNKEMGELHSKVKDIDALLSISDDKDYQVEVLKTYGLIDKKGIIVK